MRTRQEAGAGVGVLGRVALEAEADGLRGRRRGRARVREPGAHQADVLAGAWPRARPGPRRACTRSSALSSASSVIVYSLNTLPVQLQ